MPHALYIMLELHCNCATSAGPQLYFQPIPGIHPEQAGPYRASAPSLANFQSLQATSGTAYPSRKSTPL
jgi:hypothetical protein